MKKKLNDYYAPWEGWSCMFELGEKGSEDYCLEVIEADTGSLREHLIEKHGLTKEQVMRLEF